MTVAPTALVSCSLQVGIFEKSPERAARVIQSWLGEAKAEFQEMGRRAKALGKPHALFDICRDLNTLVPQELQGASGAATAMPALLGAV